MRTVTGGVDDDVLVVTRGRTTARGETGTDTLVLDWSDLAIGITGTFSGSLGEGYNGTFAWRTDQGALNWGASWNQISAQANFSPRDTGDTFVFDEALWLSNGYHIGNSASRDLWKSTDRGETWQLVNGDTPYDVYSRMEAINGYIYAIRQSVWRSQDGITWEQIAPTTPFEYAQDRYEIRSVTFSDKLWVVAPSAVWSSSDGVTWIKEADLPFDPRFNFALTVFDGRLVLSGGFTALPNDPVETGYPGFTSFNDVWTSSDGRTWEVVTENAQWSARQWSHMVEVDGALYLFGGYSNRDGINLNDMWVSRDGATWTQVELAAVFSGRHWSSVYVVGNLIVLAAGNDSVPGHAVLENDVWTFLDDGEMSWVDYFGIENFEMSLGSGDDDIQTGAGTDFVHGGAGNDTIHTDAGDDEVFGGEGDDRLHGGYGNDLLDGGSGADFLAGNQGDDVYVVDDDRDLVVENDNEGHDTVRSSISYVLGSYVENLTLIGLLAISGTGNSAANIIIGNDNDNVLAGLAGADVLDGGSGIDTVSYAASLAGVNVSLATGTGLGGDAEGDALVRIENLIGSDFDDTLEGDGGDNILTAGAGNDILDGGRGADVLTGNRGNDIYVVDNDGDVVVENDNEGHDTVRSSISYVLGSYVENLTLIGLLAISGTGNSAANIIIGNDNDNVLAGLAGADVLDGGSGIDTVSYAASPAGVNVSLATGIGLGGDAEGDALVRNENLVGTDFDDRLEGDSGDNVLIAGAGIDTITFAHATAGVTVSLALTTSQNTVGAGLDIITGFENLTGSSFNDILIGNSETNTLIGGLGNDRLDGGGGGDFLYGGDGEDLLIGGGVNEDRFLAPSQWGALSSGQERWYVADFNGDGRDDIFRYVSGFSGADVFLSTENGFETAGSWTGAGHGATPWYLGDFNGDGRSDVLRYMPTISGGQIFLSTGSGFDFNDSWTNAGFGDSGWFVGDFNGDGMDDLLRYIAGVSGGQILLSNGSSFDVPTSWTMAGFGEDRWYIGDFNGDGLDDLLRRLPGNSAQVLLSNGNQFDAPTTWAEIQTGRLLVGDINGDGRDDLLVSSQDGMQAFVSNGSTFTEHGSWTLERSALGSWYIGDFDGTGRSDLLRQMENGTVDVLLSGTPSNDTFVFDELFGRDAIQDFSRSDTIVFSESLFVDYAAVLNAAQQVGQNVSITYDLFNSITLLNMTVAQLHQDQFHFV